MRPGNNRRRIFWAAIGLVVVNALVVFVLSSRYWPYALGVVAAIAIGIGLAYVTSRT